MKKILIWTLSILLPFGFTSTTLANTEKFDATQIKAIESIVHDYLVQNPQVLVEATIALRQEEMKKATEQAKSAIRENSQALFYSDLSPQNGNAEGNVTLVEFFDYQCVHCKEMTNKVKAIKDANPNLRIVYKQFPIFGPSSEFAAKAALAAQRQDKYVEFHNALMKVNQRLSEKNILDAAKQIDLDIAKLQKDMNDPALENELKNNMALAKKLALQGTPAFIIANPKNLTGFIGYLPGAVPTAALQQAIDKANQ